MALSDDGFPSREEVQAFFQERQRENSIDFLRSQALLRQVLPRGPIIHDMYILAYLPIGGNGSPTALLFPTSEALNKGIARLVTDNDPDMPVAAARIHLNREGELKIIPLVLGTERVTRKVVMDG